MALWNRLGSLDSIKFSAVQKKDWYVPEAARAMDEGKILYAGKYNAPDFELLLKENCSLAIESTMIYHTPQIKEKLESLEIPVFVDKSSYEENPLGRMEWIKLYGIMCTKLDVAENFFQNQVAKIENAAGEADTSTRLSDHKLKRHKKSVSFFYIISNGMVVIRGSEDYIVKMIEMAGGEYAFAFANTRKTSSPSVTISMEQFYAQCASSDILIYNSSIDNTLHSKADLLSKNPLFADFKAVQTGEMWMTGKYLYQATDRIGDMILDLRAIISGNSKEMTFLEHVE
jgi:iron complex transport system substrate-binding protein